MRSSRDSSEEHMLSLVDNHSENQDLGPDELSGDENGEESVLASLTSKGKHKASILLSITTLVKTVIGAGILALPYIFSTMGIVMTAVLFLATGGMAYFMGVLLLNSKNLSGHSNYNTILYYIHPNAASKIFTSTIMVLTPLGGCIVDLLLLKSTLHKILVDIIGKESEAIHQFYTSEHMIVLVVACLELPLVLLNKIEKLRFFAFFGVSGVLVFILAFLAYFIMEVVEHPNSAIKSVQALPDDWYKAIASIPSILFSLTFQNNFFPIFKGLLDPSDSRMKKVLIGGVGTCVSWYLVVGFLGYLLSNGDLTPNFLQSVPYHSTSLPIFILMNGGFLVSLFCALPIIFFTSKNNFMALIKVFTERQKVKGWRPRDDSDNIEDVSSFIESTERTARRRKARLLYTIQTLTLYAGLVAIGYFVNSLQSVLNLVGAIGCASISIILPAYYYMKLVILRGKPKTVKFYVALGMFFFMIPFTIFSIVALYI